MQLVEDLQALNLITVGRQRLTELVDATDRADIFDYDAKILARQRGILKQLKKRMAVRFDVRSSHTITIQPRHFGLLRQFSL